MASSAKQRVQALPRRLTATFQRLDEDRGAGIILRLHRAEPFHGIRRRSEAGARKTLRAKPLLRDIAAFAPATLCRARHYVQIPRRRLSATIWPM